MSEKCWNCKEQLQTPALLFYCGCGAKAHCSCVGVTEEQYREFDRIGALPHISKLCDRCKSANRGPALTPALAPPAVAVGTPTTTLVSSVVSEVLERVLPTLHELIRVTVDETMGRVSVRRQPAGDVDPERRESRRTENEGKRTGERNRMQHRDWTADEDGRRGCGERSIKRRSSDRGQSRSCERDNETMGRVSAGRQPAGDVDPERREGRRPKKIVKQTGERSRVQHRDWNGADDGMRGYGERSTKRRRSDREMSYERGVVEKARDVDRERSEYASDAVASSDEQRSYYDEPRRARKRRRTDYEYYDRSDRASSERSFDRENSGNYSDSGRSAASVVPLSWATMPEHILTRIFNFIKRPLKRMRAGGACRLWSHALNTPASWRNGWYKFRHFQIISLNNGREISAAFNVLHKYGQHHHFIKLTLSGSDLVGSVFFWTAVGIAKELRSIVIDATSGSEHIQWSDHHLFVPAFAHLSKATLQHFNPSFTGGCPFGDDILTTLAAKQHASLTSVDLHDGYTRGGTFTPTGMLELVTKCRLLTTIVADYESLDEDVLLALVKNPNAAKSSAALRNPGPSRIPGPASRLKTLCIVGRGSGSHHGTEYVASAAVWKQLYTALPALELLIYTTEDMDSDDVTARPGYLTAIQRAVGFHFGYVDVPTFAETLHRVTCLSSLKYLHLAIRAPRDDDDEESRDEACRMLEDILRAGTSLKECVVKYSKSFCWNPILNEDTVTFLRGINPACKFIMNPDLTRERFYWPYKL